MFPHKVQISPHVQISHKMQISPVPYTIFPTRYVRIARSTFGMGGVDLGVASKMRQKLKCVLCLCADDLHRFSPFFRPPFHTYAFKTATVRAASRARSVTDAAVGNREV